MIIVYIISIIVCWILAYLLFKDEVEIARKFANYSKIKLKDIDWNLPLAFFILGMLPFINTILVIITIIFYIGSKIWDKIKEIEI